MTARPGKGRFPLIVSGLVAALSLGALAVFGPSTPSASGVGTLVCPSLNDTDVPVPPAGQTGYLFIGTSVSTQTSTISGHYTLNGGAGVAFGPITGVLEGNGAFHYVVNLPQGAVVTDAAVTGATTNTVVTVSGCLNGPAVTTTVPPTTVPPTTPTTVPATPPTTARPTAPTVPGGNLPSTGTAPRAPTPVGAAPRTAG